MWSDVVLFLLSYQLEVFFHKMFTILRCSKTKHMQHLLCYDYGLCVNNLAIILIV